MIPENIVKKTESVSPETLPLGEASLSRIFSGDDSKELWAEINRAKTVSDLRNALYTVCCRLQELESRIEETAKDDVAFGDLFEGDRFLCKGNLYTRIDGSSARRHSSESIALNHRGHGYMDSLCTFPPWEKINFCPPNDKGLARRAQDSE